MPIVMRLDRMLVMRGMSSTELASRIGTSTVNLSNIKTGKIRGMRFSTLEAICRVLECQPGDLIEYLTDEEYQEEMRLKELAKSHPVAVPVRRGRRRKL